MAATPLLTRPLYLALRRTLPDAQALINKFNTQIKQMITDRTYHRLLHVDWIRADVDGDGLLENVAASDRWARTAPERTYDLFSPAALDAEVKKQGHRSATSSAAPSTTAGRRCPTTSRSITSIAPNTRTRRRDLYVQLEMNAAALRSHRNASAATSVARSWTTVDITSDPRYTRSGIHAR